jgi:hypothetical protein
MIQFNTVKTAFQISEKFYDVSIPLTEITSSEKNLKQLAPQKMSVLIPIEQIRFWRRHELMPFYKEGKHAQVSMAQFLWLRFLQILKNFGCPTKYMQNATDYFIKRACEQELMLKNLLADKEQLISITSNAHLPTDEDVQSYLLKVRNVLLDPMLMQSIKMEINYFMSLIVFSISTGKSVDIIMDQLGQFAVLIDEEICTQTIGGFEKYDKITTTEPLIRIPIRGLIQDFFDDSNLDDKALNIKVLSEKEQEIIRAIRDKAVSSITVKKQNGEVKRLDIEKTSTDDTMIKDLKKILGLKNYQEIKCISPSDKELLVVKN